MVVEQAGGRTGWIAGPPVLVIAHEWLDLSPVMDALEALNLGAALRRRGSFIDEYLATGVFRAVLIADQTSDLSAKLALLASVTLPDDAIPCAILIQDKERPDRELLETYASLVDLVDCPGALEAFLIDRLSLDAVA